MNTPVREGETIEGSRTMRNRPYPVLKCSRSAPTLPEVRGENPSPTNAEIAAPHFACNVLLNGCQCTEISSRQTTNQQGIGVGPSTSRRPRGLHDSSSSIAIAEKNFTKPSHSGLARTATKGTER